MYKFWFYKIIALFCSHSLTHFYYYQWYLPPIGIRSIIAGSAIVGSTIVRFQNIFSRPRIFGAERWRLAFFPIGLGSIIACSAIVGSAIVRFQNIFGEPRIFGAISWRAKLFRPSVFKSMIWILQPWVESVWIQIKIGICKTNNICNL